jgi:hypothetical protein
VAVTLVEIILTLRSNTSPAAAEQVFKALSETSQLIAEKSPEEAKEVPPVEDQLKLLLDKLNSVPVLKANKDRVMIEKELQPRISSSSRPSLF